MPELTFRELMLNYNKSMWVFLALYVLTCAVSGQFPLTVPNL